MIMVCLLSLGDYASESISNISDIISKVLGFFSKIIDGILTAIEALNTLYEMLCDFDARVLQMAESCGTSEFVGMPVNEAISTFRYLTGDVCFMMIYLTVLFGCLFTIYKLVTLLFEAVDALVLQVSGVSCKSFFSNLLSNIFG